jgi:predicted N-acetyltransferase YhbS
MTISISIRNMTEGDLQEADRIMRLAFGTFLGLPDPMAFMGDADYIQTRYHSDPSGALVAEADGRIAGSCMLMNWGSVGILGPLTVRPDLWDRGVARHLLEASMRIFERWQVKHAGLFTFSQSARHVHLYQKFGFWPGFLTAIMSKPVTGTIKQGEHDESKTNQDSLSWSTYSKLSSSEKISLLSRCAELTNDIYPKLNLQREIESVENQHLGDTVLLQNGGGELAGIAICHCGPRTEAGSGNCYVKFGAAKSGQRSFEYFEHLLDACESFARSRGLSNLIAGVNTGRRSAYRMFLEKRFHTQIQGVAMHRPDEQGYDTPDKYVLDDWR